MEQRRACRVFLAVFLGILLLYVGIAVLNFFHHEIRRTPRIKNAVLDLKSWGPDSGSVVALDGEWEFFWDQWIVTEPESSQAEPDLLVRVPSQWTSYRLDGKPLPKNGQASYRISVKNCPKEIYLISYVPNLEAAYYVFMDGQLVASSGKPDRPEDQSYSKVLERLNLPEKESFDLVIEIGEGMRPGLALVPILSENNHDVFMTGLRSALGWAYIGMILISVSILIFILWKKNWSRRSMLLILFIILVFLRLLLKDELFGLTKNFIPVQQYLLLSKLLRVATNLIPFLFYLYSHELVGLPPHPWSRTKLFFYQMACTAAVFLSILLGLPRAEVILTILTHLPFLLYLPALYREVKNRTAGALAAGLSMMFLLAGMFLGSVYPSGLLVINITMVPPTFITMFVLLQDYIVVRKITDLQKGVLEATELRVKLQESETALMLSQIRPHFLYNALVAIQVLCRNDPKVAEQAVFNFAQYLRANMSSLSSREPIPFSQELYHIQNYTAIEKLRFQERLNIRYEIATQDFLVPPLTIQPLVENGIRHGASKNMYDGWVCLKTWEDGTCYYVEVSDNGPGFDAKLLQEASESSYGIRNVSFRLEALMKAQLTYQSGPKGTRALVKIPKEAGCLENNHSG